MSRYPEEARQAVIKCIGCNAPVVKTVEGSFVCVECGESPILSHEDDAADRSVDDEATFGSEAPEGLAD